MKIYVLCFQTQTVNRLLCHPAVIKETYTTSNLKYKHCIKIPWLFCFFL